MNKKLSGSSTIKYLLVAAAAYLAYKIYNLYSEIALTFLSFSLTGSILNPGISILFSINNPTSSDFLLNNVTGNISSQGVNMGTVSISQPISIPAGSTQTIPVNINASIGSLINVVQDYLSGNRTQVLHYSGIVTVNSLPIPISKDL